MRQILDGYRSIRDSNNCALRSRLDYGVFHIANVHSDWAFVDEICKTQQGLIATGQDKEILYLCQEVVNLHGGEKPKPDLSVGQNAVDMILRIEKMPFIMVTVDDRVDGYVREVIREDESNARNRRFSDHTDFILYTQKEIFENISRFRSLRIDGLDNKTTVVKYK
jgi:hypothetical protein|tara:strand:+ start:143 stop:640 length:498 start_codon:yes stop_codon:yes gene_type:complete